MALERSFLAGIAMVAAGAVMPVADDHPWLHTAATAILIIGGAILTLVRDARCQPKIDRWADRVAGWIDYKVYGGRPRRRDRAP